MVHSSALPASVRAQREAAAEGAGEAAAKIFEVSAGSAGVAGQPRNTPVLGAVQPQRASADNQRGDGRGQGALAEHAMGVLQVERHSLEDGESHLQTRERDGPSLAKRKICVRKTADQAAGRENAHDLHGRDHGEHVADKDEVVVD